MIAAECGEEDSLKLIAEGYKGGYVTKDDYTKALRYQSTLNEQKVDKYKIE